MAFFTNFSVHGQVGLLDWYTISIAIFAATILAAHGATYLTLKTEGPGCIVNRDSAHLTLIVHIATISPPFCESRRPLWDGKPVTDASCVQTNAQSNPLRWANSTVTE
jgi:hypothetical protein